MRLSLKFLKLECLFALIIFCSAITEAPGQTAVSAGVDQGYAAKVLDRILKSASITQTIAGAKEIRLLLSLDGDGRLLNCNVYKSTTIKSIDEAVCQKIKAAGPFGTPPYAQPADVSLAFFNSENHAQTEKSVPVSETPAQKKEVLHNKAYSQDTYPKEFQNYLKKITREIRDSTYIPAESKQGTYYPVARIKMDKQGKILESSILTSSGDKTIDKYLLQGIKRAGKVAAPPAGLNSTLDLTFQLVR